MHTLQNQHIQISVKPQGAELCSLIDKSTGREWIWQTDPAYWAKSSPVLFPFVGALNNNQYRYQGATYTLPRHGFAGDREFQLEASGADYLQFVLEAVLEDTTLRVQYEVSNTSDGEVYFSLGSDYRLFFEDDEILHLHPLQDNVLLRKTDTLSLLDGYLPLSYELFQHDALVTTTLQSKRIGLGLVKTIRSLGSHMALRSF